MNTISLTPERAQVPAAAQATAYIRVANEDVAAYLSSMRPGKIFTPEGLAKDVHELWDSGLFADIEVDLRRGDDGVYLRLLVRERPSIKSIEFSGNDKIEKDDLTEALDLSPR